MGIITLVRALPAGAKRFAGEVRREYRARQMAAAVDALEAAQNRFENMSVAEQMQAMHDEAAIAARANELRTKKRRKK